jgi:hypothetical protein
MNNQTPLTADELAELKKLCEASHAINEWDYLEVQTRTMLPRLIATVEQERKVGETLAKKTECCPPPLVGEVCPVVADCTACWLEWARKSLQGEAE